ncbi:unnamed protein product [Toxocara canis]|uniref:Secreted protein n=1 Tax=Toxocara canis TaxID=6265 RepID=A0A3P7FQY4_TOXCA|nr:unnamed protein product [Toxocara canis]
MTWLSKLLMLRLSLILESSFLNTPIYLLVHQQRLPTIFSMKHSRSQLMIIIDVCLCHAVHFGAQTTFRKWPTSALLRCAYLEHEASISWLHYLVEAI